MTNTFRAIDNALGAAAESYQKTVKQNQDLAIQKQQADYEQQQRGLVTQMQAYANSGGAQAGAVVGSDGTGPSYDAEDFARQHGATDAQIAATGGTAAGYNALYATLAQNPGSQGTPTDSPAPNAQVASIPPAQAGLPMTDVPTAAPAVKPVDSAPLSPAQPAPTATPVAINPGDPAYSPQAAQNTPAPAGLPVGSNSFADATIAHESAGNPTAQNSASTASGMGQFTDGTWNGLIKKNRPDLAQGKTDQQIAALKMDASPQGQQLQRDMIIQYANDNAVELNRRGIAPTMPALELAHMVGPSGAHAVLAAAKDTPLASVLSLEAIKANPTYANLTTTDLINAANKVAPAAPQSAPAAGGAAPAQPQAGVRAELTPGMAYLPDPPPALSQLAGNAYDTPVGVRVTATPKMRTPGEAMTNLANWQINHGMVDGQGGLVGLSTLSQAQQLRSKELANDEVQRQQGWTQLQHDVNNAQSMGDMVSVANKTGLFPGHLTLTQNTGSGRFSLEARDPSTGALYAVEQGTFQQIKADVASIVGDPAQRQAYLDKQEEMRLEAVTREAQAYQARKAGDASGAQVQLQAYEAPSRVAFNYSNANAANAQATETQARSQAMTMQNGLQAQRDQLVQQFASTEDPVERTSLLRRYNNLSGMLNPTITSMPGPNGSPQAHISYPNGTQTVLDAQGVEVPLGQDSRTWAKAIQGKPVNYGWHTGADGQMQLGFSTAPGALPGGQVAFSTNLNEILQELKQKPPAAPAAGLSNQGWAKRSDAAITAGIQGTGDYLVDVTKPRPGPGPKPGAAGLPEQ